MEKHRENDVESAKQSSPTSPASATSSPSHDFSFTISLQSSSSTTTLPSHNPTGTPNSLAVDLSPADDIFFHGHLLPLHLLSHLPASPRSSTNSMDSFTLPITEPEKSISENVNRTSMAKEYNREGDNNRGTKGRSKSKSFSLFGLTTRGRKGCQVRDKEDKEDKEKQKKRLRFDVVHVLKRYLRMVQPLMSGLRGRREKVRFHGHSYSGNLSLRNKPELRGKRGEYYSAPASMRTSPTNSGLLLPSTALPPASDSTMEELQAAIQAAIAHCKNSIAKEDKLT